VGWISVKCTGLDPAKEYAFVIKKAHDSYTLDLYTSLS
jgi:hypothetical protein